jgi:hypothetical protein
MLQPETAVVRSAGLRHKLTKTLYRLHKVVYMILQCSPAFLGANIMLIKTHMSYMSLLCRVWVFPLRCIQRYGRLLE